MDTEKLQKHRADCMEAMQTAHEALEMPIAATLAALQPEEVEIARLWLRGPIQEHLAKSPALAGLEELRRWLALQLHHETTRRQMVAEVEVGELYRLGGLQ